MPELTNTEYRIVSVEEAIEQGLVRESMYGLAIQEGNEIIPIDKEEAKKMVESITSPSIIVSSDGKLAGAIIEKGKETYTIPRVYTKENTPVMVKGENNKGKSIRIVQNNEEEQIEDYELYVTGAKGGITEKGIVNAAGEIEKTEKLAEPIEVKFEENTLEIKGNVELGENERLEQINRDSFMDYTYGIKTTDGKKSTLTYGVLAEKKISLEQFCEEVVDKIEKVKIEGNIPIEELECKENDSTIEEKGKWYEVDFKTIPIERREYRAEKAKQEKLERTPEVEEPEREYKIVSVEEAIEQGLVRESMYGLAIQEGNEIIPIDKEEAKKMVESITSPSIIVSSDGKLAGVIIEKGKENYTIPRVYTKENTPVMVKGENNKGKSIRIVQNNEEEQIEDYELYVTGAKGGITEKGIVNAAGEIEKTEKLAEPIEVKFEENTLEIKGNVELGKNERLEQINRDSFMDYTYGIKTKDGKKSTLTYGVLAEKKISLEQFCEEVVDKIEKVKIEGNIPIEELECKENDSTIEEKGKWYEVDFKTIPIEKELTAKEKELQALIGEDKRLDEEIEKAQSLLEKVKPKDKGVEK